MTEDELREIESWARMWANAGSGTAPLVLKLLAEHADRRRVVASLAERVAGQSELLTQRAAKEPQQ